MKKIALYIPFLKNSPKFGTGVQVYGLRLAEILTKNYQVTILLGADKDKLKVNELFDFYKLSEDFQKNVNVIYTNFYNENNTLWSDIKYKRLLNNISKNYDLFIQIPITASPGTKILKNTKCKSIHIVHFPFNKFSKAKYLKDKLSLSWLNVKRKQKLYPYSYDMFLCNSNFTLDCFYSAWGKPKNTYVLYPPMNINQIDESKLIEKENLITTIGRLAPDKHIIELAQAFKEFNKKYPDYKFLIIAQKSQEHLDYEEKIKEILNGSNYEILSNCNRSQVEQYLTKTKIYWHSKGFNEPAQYMKEHFGMSTVEAMSKGCVPVVFNGGGQIEIVDEACGRRWNTLEELLNNTEEIIIDNNKLNKMAINSINKSKEYNIDIFENNLNSYINLLFNEQ